MIFDINVDQLMNVITISFLIWFTVKQYVFHVWRFCAEIRHMRNVQMCAGMLT